MTYQVLLRISKGRRPQAPYATSHSNLLQLVRPNGPVKRWKLFYEAGNSKSLTAGQKRTVDCMFLARWR